MRLVASVWPGSIIHQDDERASEGQDDDDGCVIIFEVAGKWHVVQWRIDGIFSVIDQFGRIVIVSAVYTRS